MAKIGFLGLGTMGRGMVKNLVLAGHDVTAWNRNALAVDLIGVNVVGSISEAAFGADYVMYCLSDDIAVRAVVTSPGGLMDNVDSQTVVIDLSTIDPLTSAEISKGFLAKNIEFLDAPVFGSKGEANNGGLWIVVGGARQVYEKALEVLEPISETTHYMGASGNGAQMKLVGNLIVAAQLEALGEALTLAKNADLNLQDVLGVLRVTDFKSPIFDGVGAAVLNGDYSPSFALNLMLKDALLVQAFAGRLGSPIPGTEATLNNIRDAVMAGWGDENASAIIKVIAQKGGVDLGS